MKIKAGDLRGLAEALSGIAEVIPLELDAAYQLIEIAAKVSRGHQAFESRRIPLLLKFGKKKDGKLVTADDGSVEFDGDNGTEFAEEFDVLANEDIEFGFEPIALDLLKLRADGEPYLDDNGKPIRILPRILRGLFPIIKRP